MGISLITDEVYHYHFFLKVSGSFLFVSTVMEAGGWAGVGHVG